MKKVKSIKSYIITGETDENGYLSSYEERDEQGATTLEESLDLEGNLEMKVIRSYNDKGQLIEEQQYTETESPDEIHQFHYAASGEIEKIEVKYKDGSCSYKNYVKDEAESTITINIKDEAGNYEGKEFRKFDSEGRVLEEIIYDENDAVHEQKETLYDDHGRVIERYEVDASGFEKEYYYDYEMDEAGNFTEVRTVNPKEEVIRIDHFVYDEKSNRIQHNIKDKEAGYARIIDWEYDEKDRMTKQKVSMPDGQLLQEVVLTYDEEDRVLERQTTDRHGVETHRHVYEFYS